MARQEDHFESAIGSQAAVMNAWILWRFKEKKPWTIEDLKAALPCVTDTAVEPHIRRLRKDSERGGYVMEVTGQSGLFEANPAKVPF
ncbi:MAG: hypothetical protein JNM43_19590 [Planctomycetaceae bacterium]|nr:hypothetical protein [Planctomycetaceae bacterium]